MRCYLDHDARYSSGYVVIFHLLQEMNKEWINPVILMYYNINHSAGKIKLKNELNVLKLFFFLLCSTATCAYTSIKVKWSKSKHDTHCDWHFKYKLEKELTYRLFEWGNRRLQIVRSLFKKVTSQHKLRGYESLWTGNNLLVPNEWGEKKPQNKTKKAQKKFFFLSPLLGPVYRDLWF